MESISILKVELFKIIGYLNIDVIDKDNVKCYVKVHTKPLFFQWNIIDAI